MAITERRRQFLEALQNLYKEKNRPLHYYEIAKLVKVSPATAYDILQLLHKEGYIETVYEESSKKRGRKRVYFRPKEENSSIIINIDRTNPFILCVSFLLFLLKKLQWSEEIKNYLLFILGTFKINTEILLLLVPLLILGYLGKNIYQGLNKEAIKKNLEDYWKALSNLADEEKKALYNLILSMIKNV